MSVSPYLFFNGLCEEAIAFYREALGAELETLMRYRENPEPPQTPLPEGVGEKIMHAAFRIGDTRLFASDGDCSGEPMFQGFAITLNAPSAAEAARLFEAIARDGAPIMPFGPTFFSEGFGMARDKFGLGWMVMAPPLAGASSSV